MITLLRRPSPGFCLHFPLAVEHLPLPFHGLAVAEVSSGRRQGIRVTPRRPFCLAVQVCDRDEEFPGDLQQSVYVSVLERNASFLIPHCSQTLLRCKLCFALQVSSDLVL
jgi:hypothetical protein